MFPARHSHSPKIAALFGAATFIAMAMTLGGCKGNTSAAALPEHPAGTPPVVRAQRTGEPLANIDPLMAPAWQAAQWRTLLPPANSSRSTPPSRAAVLFDSQNLYVAVVCELPSSPEEGRDVVSLYLDPTNSGRELMQISTDSSGITACSWIRSAVPLEPNADGSPNLDTPLDIRPSTKLSGLVTHVSQGTTGDTQVWAITMSVPAASLPPLMQRPLSGEWRFNVVRTVTSTQAGQRHPQQSNLSPVFVNAQAYSPYRMATLTFDADPLAAGHE